jgi:hypothetical protein
MGDEMKCFSLRGDTPMISVLFYIVGGEEDEEEDCLESTIIAQTSNLTN